MREILAIASQITTQSTGNGKVAAWRPAQAKVNASGIKRFERAKLFGNYQRCVVG